MHTSALLLRKMQPSKIFPLLSESMPPPTNAQEALDAATNFLKALNLEQSEVLLEAAPSEPEPLRGTRIKALIPIEALEKLLEKIANAIGSDHGIRIAAATITADQSGDNCLHIQTRVETKIMGGTVPIFVSGFLDAPEGTRLRVRDLGMPSSSGMFANMAAAIVRPRLAYWEGASVSLESIAGTPLFLNHLASENSSLQAVYTFT
jgi:hypothetical protein